MERSKKAKWIELVNTYRKLGNLWGEDLLLSLDDGLLFAQEVIHLGLHITAIDSWFIVPTEDKKFAVAPALESFVDAEPFGRSYLTLEDIKLMFRERLSTRVSYVSFHLDIPDDWIISFEGGY